jgi:DNA mismatch endonuclease (patch repair protein)
MSVRIETSLSRIKSTIRASLNSVRAPSFKGLSAASTASSQAKRMNRAVDTEHERLLRSHLWKSGFRFRKNVKSLPGKPDIVFSKQKLVIFCDGDFWHGRNWSDLSAKLSIGNNSRYWVEKVRTNRERDARNSALLAESGWTVLRFWESDIRRTPETIAREIALQIRSKTFAK